MTGILKLFCIAAAGALLLGCDSEEEAARVAAAEAERARFGDIVMAKESLSVNGLFLSLDLPDQIRLREELAQETVAGRVALLLKEHEEKVAKVAEQETAIREALFTFKRHGVDEPSLREVERCVTLLRESSRTLGLCTGDEFDRQKQVVSGDLDRLKEAVEKVEP